MSKKGSRAKHSAARRRKHSRTSTQKRAAPAKTKIPARPGAWDPIRSHALPLIVLVFITFVAYANAWPDSLAFDDKYFAVSERFSGLGLAGLARFFTENLWSVGGTDVGLYRPLLLVSMAIDVLIFGDWAAGYHLSNILLHIISTVVVYGLVRHLLIVTGGTTLQSGHLALLAAVIFAVHPVHTEVVNSIFNRSEMLVTLGTVGGLWWFLNIYERQAKLAWIGLSLVYFLVLLSKESSAMMPVLAGLLIFLTTSGSRRQKLHRCMPVLWLLIPLGIYLALRANALDGRGASEMTDLALYGMSYDGGRILPAVGVWFDSLKIMLWPHPLQIYHDKPELNNWIALALQGLLMGAAFVGVMRNRIGLFLGLSFFYITILPSSRIIGELNAVPALAERYLYLPSVGFVIVLAFGLRWLVQAVSFRIAVVPVVVVVLIFTPLTWARNADWASNVLLFEGDYEKLENKNQILDALVGVQLQEQNYTRAAELCDLHARMGKSQAHLDSRCGSAYGHLGRYDQAEQAFSAALENKKWAPMAHFQMAEMYVLAGRKEEARQHFEASIAGQKSEFLKEFQRAVMLLRLYPGSRSRLLEAKAHLEQAILLQPQFFNIWGQEYLGSV